MTVLCIILGVLLIAGGFSCIFTPLLTFMDAGYFVVILMCVFGVAGIIRSIGRKRFGVTFVFSIISVLLGIIMLLFPESLLLAQGMMLILTAVWLVLMGLVAIINAVTVTRATGSKIWILQLILGILGILLGCYCFFHPMLTAVTLGILIGAFFIETGFTLIFSGIAVND